MQDNKEINWLNSISESSKPIYQHSFKLFKEFTGLSAEQILEARKTDEIGISTLFAFKKFLKDKGLSDNTAKTCLGVVKGFLAHYRVNLFFTRGEKSRIYNTARTTEDYKFTRKDIAKMSLVANLEENYILLLGKSLGLRASDFLKFSYGDFRQLDLNQEAPIFIKEVLTQKKKVSAFCFIDSDSLPVIKAMLNSNKTKKDGDPVIDVRISELTVILQRIAHKASIDTGNKHVRFHCLRKWFISRISASTSESQWKQFVGKKIAEGAYVSHVMLEKVYKNALKDLTVMGGGNGHSAKVEKLEQENTVMRNLFISMLGGREKIEKILSEKVHTVGDTGKSMNYSTLSDFELLEMYQKFI